MGSSTFKRLCGMTVSALLASTVTLHLPTASTRLHLDFHPEAIAKSSGGRSSGGSFRPSSPSRSTGSSSPSRTRDSSPSSPNRYDDRRPTVVPVPIYNDPYRYNQNGSYNSSTSSSGSGVALIVGLIFLGVSAAVIFAIVYFAIRAIKGGSKAGRAGELDNDIVTVSKIQVALLAEAREIQANLSQFSLEADTSTPEGLQALLQESVLALLRSPENWSHVLASSQTVKTREEAETLFSKLSMAERTKMSVETLTNVGGRTSRREFKPSTDEDPASYIVVTLLVGTAHDKPLFEPIRTEQALKEALEKLASLPADYLMVFELLWSPQEETDSLTYDELLTEYTEMVQI